MRVVITAPAGTPYAHGLFVFDLFVPDVFPTVPPQMKLLTTGGGTCRFSPNLYAGKCLLIVCVCVCGRIKGCVLRVAVA